MKQNQAKKPSLADLKANSGKAVLNTESITGGFWPFGSMGGCHLAAAPVKK